MPVLTLTGSLQYILYPYRQGVDSLKTMKIGRLAQEFTVGSQLLLNWVADAIVFRFVS